MDIENYKKLLFAIINTDEGNQTEVICVYDTHDNERLTAIFNSIEKCGKFFSTTSAVIRKNIERQSLKNYRFKIEKIKL
jgi:hypothetical protein